jgi:hypothetical protein
MLKMLLLGLFIMTNLNAQHTNHLVNEDSPYLQQHAHNTNKVFENEEIAKSTYT